MFGKKRIGIFILIGVVFLFSVSIFSLQYIHDGSYAEEEALAGVVWSEKQYTDYFSHLAEAKGSHYAFELLRRITPPHGVNVHTVAHAVGFVLFKERGVSGMYDCTEEFRSACAHAIVIQAISRDGSNALEDVVRTCMNAPGGKGAYAICIHGVGHGLVASAGYDFESAVSRCAEMPLASDDAYPSHRFMNVAEECIGGAVMEMLQGDHDKGTWERAIIDYLPVDNPFRPCTDTYVPLSLRSACLAALTQRFFGFAGISEEIPQPETYSKAMNVCALARLEDDRIACYGGFGKEYVFYATQLDGGDVNRLSDDALKNIQEWCAYAGNPKGIKRCLSIALDTLFWAGQNDPRPAITFCSLLSEENRTACYVGLVENIKYFLQGKENAESVCDALPPTFQQDCSADSALLFTPVDFGTIHI